MKVGETSYRTVWMEGSQVCLIDQPRLPYEFRIARLSDHRQTAIAIREMVVRGAGAIGATGGFGMAQAFLEAPLADPVPYLAEAASRLRATRPTAQNLFFAIDRVLAAAQVPLHEGWIEEAKARAIAEAQRIADEDALACRRIGEHGASLLPQGARVSTHCNAGWLAFVDWGSALSPIYVAHRAGRDVRVFVDETRPRGQGSRLTAWELQQEGIPFELLSDSATASFLARGEIDLVIVGADRIAANGDVANKIGSYPLALAAREAGVPFYVAAPSSTFDPDCPHGAVIPIEERHGDEVLYVWGADDDGHLRRVRIGPPGASARNPAFDVTPHRLIRGIVTEFGVLDASPAGVQALLRARREAYGRG